MRLVLIIRITIALCASALLVGFIYYTSTRTARADAAILRSIQEVAEQERAKYVIIHFFEEMDRLKANIILNEGFRENSKRIDALLTENTKRLARSLVDVGMYIEAKQEMAAITARAEHLDTLTRELNERRDIYAQNMSAIKSIDEKNLYLEEVMVAVQKDLKQVEHLNQLGRFEQLDIKVQLQKWLLELMKQQAALNSWQL